jgi:hypothetical protein
MIVSYHVNSFPSTNSGQRPRMQHKEAARSLGGMGPSARPAMGVSLSAGAGLAAASRNSDGSRSRSSGKHLSRSRASSSSQLKRKPTPTHSLRSDRNGAGGYVQNKVADDQSVRELTVELATALRACALSGNVMALEGTAKPPLPASR